MSEMSWSGMEEVKAHLIVALVSSFVGALFALYMIPEWILYIIFIVLVLLLVLTVFALHAITRKFNLSLAARTQVQTDVLSSELSSLRDCLKELQREKIKPKRLPAVFGRLIDDSLQQLIDLSLRDFVGAWNTEQGFGSSEQFVQDVKEDIWKMVTSFQERLSKVDITKVVCVDLINQFLNHIKQIRQAKSASPANMPPDYNIFSPLKSTDSEKDHLREITSALMKFLFPPPYSSSEPVKHLLREIFTCKVLFPTIEILTNPDFINEKILAYMELVHPQVALAQKNSYKRPESLEDFIKIINDLSDIDVLKHIRYDIVSEIMAATNMQNLDQARGFDQFPSACATMGSATAELSQMKLFVTQLSYAKGLCEKRLHALGWMGYPAEELEEAVEAESVAGKEPPPLLMVINSAQGRHFLGLYLKQNESPDLIGFWMAVEELRQSKRCNWHDLGAEIFYTYIHTPSSPIKTDKMVVKRMEAFLLGDNGPEVFYELQDTVLHTLENMYCAFLSTDIYPQMITALESPDSEDRDLAEDQKTACTDHSIIKEIEDKSNYSRYKLTELQEKLENKERALHALRTSLKPDSRVLTQLEGKVESLKGDICHLETHATRTDTWGEHLGQWRVYVQDAEMSEDKESPQFVLVVHLLEDDKDRDSVSIGWVVQRKLPEFHELHRKLCQLTSDLKQLELPSQFKFRLGKNTVKNALEKAKIQTQKFLQFVLEDERLNQCEALYTFLIPSSDYLKQGLQAEKKHKFSFSAMFKSGGWEPKIFRYPSSKEPVVEDVSLLCDSTEGAKSLGDSTDSIAEPLYALLIELCDLNSTFKLIRRTLITTVTLTYNRSVNRAVRVMIADLFSEQNVYSYIQNFIRSWWPDGQLNQSLSDLTDEEKKHIRLEVRERLLGSIPFIVTNLVGQQNARLGATKVFDALQDPALNKQLLYELIAILLHEVCPELRK